MKTCLSRVESLKRSKSMFPRQPHDINIKSIKQIGNYSLGREIGSGAFGKVVLGKHITTEEKVAIKILDKMILNQVPEDYELVRREISILKIVKHKYIVQLYEILETPQHIFIVMEYCEGKDMMDYILTKTHLSEQESLKFFQQLINALFYLHSQNISHRDIKIDNMLLDGRRDLKLVDFGLSIKYSDDDLLDQPCGTIVYAAPEVLDGREYHGMLADVWSSGIVLYGMLSGFLPFNDPEDEVNKQNVIRGVIEYPDFFSPLVKDLLTHMLDVNPMTRYTLQEIKDHPWFNLIDCQLIPGIIIGFNLIPIDEKILDFCSTYNYDREKVKDSVIHNRFDEGSALYFLLVKQFKRKGIESISDFCSDEFINFVLDENNLIFPEGRGENEVQGNINPNMNIERSPENRNNENIRNPEEIDLENRRLINGIDKGVEAKIDNDKVDVKISPNDNNCIDENEIILLNLNNNIPSSSINNSNENKKNDIINKNKENEIDNNNNVNLNINNLIESKKINNKSKISGSISKNEIQEEENKENNSRLLNIVVGTPRKNENNKKEIKPTLLTNLLNTPSNNSSKRSSKIDKNGLGFGIIDISSNEGDDNKEKSVLNSSINSKNKNLLTESSIYINGLNMNLNLNKTTSQRGKIDHNFDIDYNFNYTFNEEANHPYIFERNEKRYKAILQKLNKKNKFKINNNKKDVFAKKNSLNNSQVSKKSNKLKQLDSISLESERSKNKGTEKEFENEIKRKQKDNDSISIKEEKKENKFENIQKINLFQEDYRKEEKEPKIKKEEIEIKEIGKDKENDINIANITETKESLKESNKESITKINNDNMENNNSIDTINTKNTPIGKIKSDKGTTKSIVTTCQESTKTYPERFAVNTKNFMDNSSVGIGKKTYSFQEKINKIRISFRINKENNKICITNNNNGSHNQTKKEKEITKDLESQKQIETEKEEEKLLKVEEIIQGKDLVIGEEIPLENEEEIQTIPIVIEKEFKIEVLLEKDLKMDKDKAMDISKEILKEKEKLKENIEKSKEQEEKKIDNEEKKESNIEKVVPEGKIEVEEIQKEIIINKEEISPCQKLSEDINIIKEEIIVENENTFEKKNILKKENGIKKEDSINKENIIDKQNKEKKENSIIKENIVEKEEKQNNNNLITISKNNSEEKIINNDNEQKIKEKEKEKEKEREKEKEKEKEKALNINNNSNINIRNHTDNNSNRNNSNTNTNNNTVYLKNEEAKNKNQQKPKRLTKEEKQNKPSSIKEPQQAQQVQHQQQQPKGTLIKTNIYNTNIKNNNNKYQNNNYNKKIIINKNLHSIEKKDNKKQNQLSKPKNQIQKNPKTEMKKDKTKKQFLNYNMGRVNIIKNYPIDKDQRQTSNVKIQKNVIKKQIYSKKNNSKNKNNIICKSALKFLFNQPTSISASQPKTAFKQNSKLNNNLYINSNTNIKDSSNKIKNKYSYQMKTNIKHSTSNNRLSKLVNTTGILSSNNYNTNATSIQKSSNLNMVKCVKVTKNNLNSKFEEIINSDKNNKKNTIKSPPIRYLQDYTNLSPNDKSKSKQNTKNFSTNTITIVNVTKSHNDIRSVQNNIKIQNKNNYSKKLLNKKSKTSNFPITTYNKKKITPSKNPFESKLKSIIRLNLGSKMKDKKIISVKKSPKVQTFKSTSTGKKKTISTLETFRQFIYKKYNCNLFNNTNMIFKHQKRSNHLESSVSATKYKSPFEVRELSESPKQQFLNQKARHERIPWKIKKKGIDEKKPIDLVYHNYLKKVHNPLQNNKKIGGGIVDISVHSSRKNSSNNHSYQNQNHHFTGHFSNKLPYYINNLKQKKKTHVNNKLLDKNAKHINVNNIIRKAVNEQIKANNCNYNPSNNCNTNFNYNLKTPRNNIIERNNENININNINNINNNINSSKNNNIKGQIYIKNLVYDSFMKNYTLLNNSNGYQRNSNHKQMYHNITGTCYNNNNYNINGFINLNNNPFYNMTNSISMNSLMTNKDGPKFDLDKGIIDLSCLFVKAGNLNECFGDLIYKLRKNNISFVIKNNNTFRCTKNGLCCDIEIIKVYTGDLKNICNQNINNNYLSKDFKKENNNKNFYYYRIISRKGGFTINKAFARIILSP